MHEMHQGISQLVDHPFVQLCFLAAVLRQIANDTFEATEEWTHGNHARFQHAALETIGHAGKLNVNSGDFSEPDYASLMNCGVVTPIET